MSGPPRPAGSDVGLQPAPADQLKACPGLIPTRLKIMAAGQNPVKLAWIMLSATKAVSKSQ
jgi:hypothetical protein